MTEGYLYEFMTQEQQEIDESVRVQTLQNQVLNERLEELTEMYGTKAKMMASFRDELLANDFTREEVMTLLIEQFYGMGGV